MHGAFGGWRIPKQHQAIESPVFTQPHNSAPSVGLRSDLLHSITSWRLCKNRGTHTPWATISWNTFKRQPAHYNTTKISCPEYIFICNSDNSFTVTSSPLPSNSEPTVTSFTLQGRCRMKKKAMNFWPVIQTAEEALQLGGNQSPPSTLSLLSLNVSPYHPINPH